MPRKCFNGAIHSGCAVTRSAKSYVVIISLERYICKLPGCYQHPVIFLVAKRVKLRFVKLIVCHDGGGDLNHSVFEVLLPT